MHYVAVRLSGMQLAENLLQLVFRAINVTQNSGNSFRSQAARKTFIKINGFQAAKQQYTLTVDSPTGQSPSEELSIP